MYWVSVASSFNLCLYFRLYYFVVSVNYFITLTLKKKKTHFITHCFITANRIVCTRFILYEALDSPQQLAADKSFVSNILLSRNCNIYLKLVTFVIG